MINFIGVCPIASGSRKIRQSIQADRMSEGRRGCLLTVLFAVVGVDPGPDSCFSKDHQG